MTHILTKTRDKNKLNKLFEYAKDIGLKLEFKEDVEAREDEVLAKLIEKSKLSGISDIDSLSHIIQLRSGNKVIK